MNIREIGREPIFDRFAGCLMADGDGAPGGGSPPADAAVTPPAPVAGVAGAVEPPKPGDAPADSSAPKSLLTEAVAPPAEKTEAEKAAEALANETPEQKAERLKNETPEQKTARVAQEAKDAETAKAARIEALKPYDALKLPEGMPADQPAVVDFKNTALDLGVEPEKAQKLIDAVAPKLQAAVDAPYKLWAETQVGWIKAAENDPEYGGANFEKNLGIAALAIDKFGGKPLREAFAFTGAGSNPEILRAFYRMGLSLREGQPVPGRPASAEKPPLASRMYPTMNN